jgi:hypothetical protein
MWPTSWIKKSPWSWRRTEKFIARIAWAACNGAVFQSATPCAKIIQSEILLLARRGTVLAIGALTFQVRDIKS